MKKLINKKIIISILLIFIFFGVFLSIKSVFASDPVTYRPQISLPGFFKTGEAYKFEESTRSIANYVKAIYNYLLSVVGLLAAIVLMVAGVIWMTAGGNSGRISEAKSWITGALTGLVLMLLSYVILLTINPYLVDFKITEIEGVARISYGCCKLSEYKFKSNVGNIPLAQNVSGSECYRLALLSREPGIMGIEELKKNEIYKSDPEKYMIDKKKYFPGYAAIGSNCEAVGACLMSTYKHEITVARRQGVTEPEKKINYLSSFVCANTTQTGCKYSESGILQGGIFLKELRCQDPKDKFIDHGIEYTEKYIQDISEEVKNKAKSEFVMQVINCKGGEETGEGQCYITSPNGINLLIGYSYQNLFFGKKGEKWGEPCGNDVGSICIGIDSCSNRDVVGGRGCGGDLWCCERSGYQDKLPQ